MSTAARRYLLRGRAALERGDDDQALESLASAVDLAPRSCDARLAYAVALSRIGDAPRAAQTLRSGLAQVATDPGRAALWFQLGEVLTMAGDFRAAEDAFLQAELFPGWAARARAGLARVLAKSGRHQEAIAALAIAARPPRQP